MKQLRILPALSLLCFIALLNPARGQSCLPAPSGLIHWYRGDVEGSDSAGTNSGTVQGGVTITNGGKVGGAFLFDGVSGGVNLGTVPDLDFAPDSSFSLEAWFNTFGPTSPAQDGRDRNLNQVGTRLNRGRAADLPDSPAVRKPSR